ncbi:uncharacterized protein LOC143250254 [Tachypleus tridentatus]|uniref:uncharacterized protein LOC143250254 n=1 Tax=Tachypleus tridentatus TaxID=6853 RepID=UPI003FCF952E
MSKKTSPQSQRRNRSASIPTNSLSTSSSLLQRRKGLPCPVENPLHRSPSPLPHLRSNDHPTLRITDHRDSILTSCSQVSPDSLGQRPEVVAINEPRSPKLWLQSKTFSSSHGRSYSFRNMRRPTPQQLAEEEQFRPRGATMPSDSTSYLREKRKQRLRERSPNLSSPDHTESEYDTLYRIRSFSITPKGGVINRGDRVRQRSRSSNSMASSYTYPSCPSTATSCSSGPGTRCTHLKVLMLGATGVGKRSIVSQFMSSEYMNTYDTSQTDEEPEKTVFLLLDGEEYELTLINQQSLTSPKDLREDTAGSADAYVVVYSVTERETFEIAVDILFGLRERGYTSIRAVILVGNKSDLVRSRTVSIVEGKSVAISYESKFMETSAVISHKTDDLLVGIVTQIRLKNQQKKEFNHFSPTGRGHRYHSKSSLYGASRRARDMLYKFLGKERYKSKSCDNLHVL